MYRVALIPTPIPTPMPTPTPSALCMHKQTVIYIYLLGTPRQAKREAMWPRQLPPGGRAGTALAYPLGRVLSCGCSGWVIGCTYIRTQTPTYLFIQTPTYLFREFRDLCGCDDPFRMTLNCTYHLHTYSTYEDVSNLINLLDCRRGEVCVVTCMWWGVVWES